MERGERRRSGRGTGGSRDAVGAALGGAGAAAFAAASAACCVPVVSPVLIAVLGASGSVWISGLKPFSPYLLGASAFLLGYASWRRFGAKSACRTGGRADPGPRHRFSLRLATLILAASAVIWLVGVILYFIWS